MEPSFTHPQAHLVLVVCDVHIAKVLNNYAAQMVSVRSRAEKCVSEGLRSSICWWYSEGDERFKCCSARRRRPPVTLSFDPYREHTSPFVPRRTRTHHNRS